MDGKDLYTRDLILGVEFENLSCEQAVAEYEKRGVISFERALTSMYSKRMVEAFDSKGAESGVSQGDSPSDTVMTKNRKAFITAVLCFKQHNLTISRSANAAEK